MENIAYCYDQAGRFTHQEVADVDPLVPGAVLWPARSTPVAPPPGVPSRWDGTQWHPDEDGMAALLRRRRNELLAATDFLVLPDYPHKPGQRAEVVAYRMMLRELTNQDGFPVAVVWPQAPTFVAHIFS